MRALSAGRYRPVATGPAGCDRWTARVSFRDERAVLAIALATRGVRYHPQADTDVSHGKSSRIPAFSERSDTNDFPGG
jgi:hypothetical protein